MEDSIDQIKRIEIYRCPVRLKDPFIISLGKLEYADNVIVVIKTKKGITGFGECSPFRTIHGEDGETCMSLGRLLAKTLIGKNVFNISSNMKLLDALIYGNTSVKSAFDIAMHDIASQNARLPLFRFLGGTRIRTLVTDYTVSFDTPEKMAEDAGEIARRGFTVIKVKLGGSESDDVKRLNAIRAKIGDQIPLRIDANQGWTVDSAKSILKKISGFNIQHCEEPVSRKLFLELPGIRKESKIPIMADESCFDDVEAERLISIGACDMINVKLGKSSGLLKARAIVELAEKNNMKLQAGGFLESRLGFTAAAHLALSSDNFDFIDFDTPLMFSEDPVSGGIVYSENGRITVPEEAGLGASFTEDVLKRLERIIVE